MHKKDEEVDLSNLTADVAFVDDAVGTASAVHGAKAKKRERQAVLGFVLAISMMIIGSIVYAIITNDDEINLPDNPELAGVVAYYYQGGEHTRDDVDYSENPPAGGAHNAVWQNCDTYANPVVEERAVHSLEHGAVWITYLPTLPASQVAELVALADLHPYILLSPREGLASPIVATAWNHQIPLASATDPMLVPFVREFVGSFTSPEPGAPCTGGSSENSIE